MKRPYETVVVFDGTIGDDALQKEQSRFEDFLKSNGSFEETVVWGKRELAYEINRKRLGYYCLFHFEGEGDLVGKIDADFRLNTNILRHLTLIRDLKKERLAAQAAEKKRNAAHAEEQEETE